jgi:hypothetical protein
MNEDGKPVYFPDLRKRHLYRGSTRSMLTGSKRRRCCRTTEPVMPRSYMNMTICGLSETFVEKIAQGKIFFAKR